MSVIGILSAIIARKTTGAGQHVDVSMFDGILPFMGMIYANYKAGGGLPERGNTFLSGALVCYDIYRTKDDRHLTMGALEFKFWKRFCELVGKPEWTDKQFVTGNEYELLHGELSELFLTKTMQEWVDLLRDGESMVDAVLRIDEVERDPHAIARKMIVEMDHPTEGKITGIGVPIKFSETQATDIAPPPILGQHNDEILSMVGLDKTEIERLRTDGIIV